MAYLNLRQHYVYGGSSSYSSVNDTNFYLYAYGNGSEISAWLVFDRSWLHGKKVRYTRQVGGYSGTDHKFVYVEIMDGAYLSKSDVHFPDGAPRTNLGNGTLLLIEQTHADGTNTTKTTGVLDLSGGAEDKVSLCWRIYGRYNSRYWSMTVTSIEILDAADNVLYAVDFDDYAPEGTTSGQNYGTMGSIPIWFYTPVSQSLAQAWHLMAERTVVGLDQAWHIMASILQTGIEQKWGLRLGADLSQYWGAAQPLTLSLSQPFSDASIVKRPLSQHWRSFLLLKSNLNQLWASLSRTQVEFLQKWVIANSIVVNDLNALYDIRNVSSVSASLNQQYWLTGNTQVSSLSSQYVSIDGEAIYPVSINLKSSIDQYAITASIELADRVDLDKFIVGSTVTLHGCLNTVFTLIVDDYGYDLAFDSDSFKVELVSPAAILDAPYSELVTGDYSGLASSICSDIAGTIPLSWGTLDWFIGENLLSVNEDSPLSVIRRVANEIGSRVQSTPSGGISVISRYPYSCNVWRLQEPVVEINKATQVVSEQYTYEQAPGYNNFSVGNDDTSDSILRIEVDEISSSSKLVKVFVYPDTLPTVTHSGNSATVSLTYNGAINDSVEAQVEFVGGEGSVNGPIDSIQTYSWKYRNLGSVTYEPTGVLYASIGDSLMDLTYRTKFYSYSVNTSILEDIQIIVEADI